MNQYVTGAMIRRLREERKMTQQELADILQVSDKAVSKWETGRGYPDITLLEPLAKALGVSVMELLSGCDVSNGNRSCNMRKVRFYVCPVCGNILFSTGDAVISCCGITLPALEAEEPDEEHALKLEKAEDEWYIASGHPMTKGHFLSFLAAVQDNGVQIVKLYPEGAAEARVPIRRTMELYWYCSRHGLFRFPRRELLRLLHTGSNRVAG